MSRFLPLLFIGVFAAPPMITAAVVGTNPPARPLATALATLPSEQQPVWQQYLARSKKQHATDEAFLKKEMGEAGLTEQLVPPKGRAVSLRQPDAWYGSDEARKMAVCVISFQTPAGGWNKNTKMTERPRLRGERFGVEEGYVGTFDNDATITELQFLAKVVAAGGESETAAACRRAFGRGLEYIFAAQYPNGGWPQVWPLEGWYHDAITFNDGAMTHVLRFLRDVSEGKNEFAFVSSEQRSHAADSMNQGLACLLKAQITVKGKRTVWCQQYDILTIEPTSARNYEMPSQSSGESADILTFLMEFEKPTPQMIAAVHSGAAWFKKTMITGKVFKSTGEDGRRLIDAPPDTQTWPRFSEIGSDRPLFGDRDKTIHDVVDEISKERRNGYAWYNASGTNLLKRYDKWAVKFPAPK